MVNKSTYNLSGAELEFLEAQERVFKPHEVTIAIRNVPKGFQPSPYRRLTREEARIVEVV